MKNGQLQTVEVIYIKKLISKTTQFIRSIINELFILSGLSLIAYATYVINTIAAMYLLGAVLVLFGVFLALTRRE
ncbi:hypothetical protein M3638_02925 [Oceanobacillus profundus]|uniref:hypothetical protein n=1 Tax=Oceanobacillus profundus TaxID=372463 RepID=UPI00203D4636|nr:hypothetical protein [Oceanobacillus profundus]MCM3396792.1 hypothetical protein [Oceanobacillus profundus]